MDKRRKAFAAQVKSVLYRDYIGRKDCRSRWVEAVLRKTNLEALYMEGYTEEAAAQKIYQKISRYLKPESKSNRLIREEQRQEVTGMAAFQMMVKADRYYRRLPTEQARTLFLKILQILNRNK